MKYTFEKVQELLKEKVKIIGEYRNTHSKTEVECLKCHYKWNADIHSLLQGTGCPACAGRVPRIGENDFSTLHKELLKEWDYEKNKNEGIYPEQYTSRSGKKVHWKCSKCGYEWITSIDKRVNGSNCPECAKSIVTKKRINKFINKRGSFAKNYPNLMKEWDFELNNKLSIFPEEQTKTSNKTSQRPTIAKTNGKIRKWQKQSSTQTTFCFNRVKR